MSKLDISRRKFLGAAGVAGAAAAMSLAGCSSSDAESEGAAEATAEAAEYGDPIGFPTPVASAENAVWKVDYVNDDLAADFVHDNWRMALDEFDSEKIQINADLGLNTDVSREGMDTLQTAGGADFTAKQLDWIIDQFAERAGIGTDKLTVFDLRGETHGLVNGDVFMSWIENNYVNESKPTAQIVEEEQKAVDEFKAAGAAEMYETIDWAANFEKPMVEYKDAEFMTEAELCESKGVKYVRFASTNHFRPDDGCVDELVEYVLGMPEDEWVFMHCYAGEGRTTCFMVLVDMIKNYKVASADDIMARQGLIGPVDVRTEAWTTGKEHYKKKASIERRVFLQLFYKYLTETDGQGQTWTEWARDYGVTLEYYPPKLG